MNKKPNYYNQIIRVLEDLREEHPTYNIGKHLSTALDGSDLWGMTDKAIYTALKKYAIELDSDLHDDNDDDLEEIIKEGINIKNICSNDLFEEDEDDEY